MKKLFLAILTITIFSCQAKKESSETENKTTEQSTEQPTEKGNIYSYKVKDIDGNDYDFNDLKGKKIMIVNTASECGFTKQYENLENLYKKYKDKDFVIVGFPANNFSGQEPGTNKEIKQFCSDQFSVTFPMMSKISVKGEDQAQIYQFLTKKEKNGVMDSEVKWNFQKYLINPDGTLANVYYSKTLPDSPEIIEWIEQPYN